MLLPNAIKHAISLLQSETYVNSDATNISL